MAKTNIEWSQMSWNPIAAYFEDKRGWMCSKPSLGCKNCYSEALNLRLGNGLRYTPENVGKAEWRLVNLDEPMKWRKPRMVFVCSMTDLFHEAIPDEMIGQAWSAMLATPRHVFQVLTKRAERMHALVTRFRAEGERKGLRSPDHIWLGVSVENQEQADKRIPELLDVPARVRFLSVEPCLGPIDFDSIRVGCGWRPLSCSCSADCAHEKIDWVIVGGESGPHSRPFNCEWARSIINQCSAAGVAVFVKQLGARPYDDEHPQGAHWRLGRIGGLNLSDRKGGEPNEWPEDLRVRQFPQEINIDFAPQRADCAV